MYKTTPFSNHRLIVNDHCVVDGLSVLRAAMDLGEFVERPELVLGEPASESNAKVEAVR